MRQLKIKAYWWCEVPNFGDALAPFLLKRFADVETTWDTVSRASVVSIGSLLDHIPPLWDGYVLGSGKLYESSRLHLHTKTANILALRGPLSAAQSPPGDYAIGDPGLLAPELIPLPEKLYDLGILPHWSDHSLEHDPQFRSPKWSTMLIRPEWPPLEVVQRIGMCRKIVTSSLHGMVVADAYGIPGGLSTPRPWHARVSLSSLITAARFKRRLRMVSWWRPAGSASRTASMTFSMPTRHSDLK